jgi:hypothetical protein
MTAATGIPRSWWKKRPKVENTTERCARRRRKGDRGHEEYERMFSRKITKD